MTVWCLVIIISKTVIQIYFFIIIIIAIRFKCQSLTNLTNKFKIMTQNTKKMISNLKMHT